MLPRSPLAEKGVDLVDKYDRGLEVPEQQVGAIEGRIMVVVDRHDHCAVQSNWILDKIGMNTTWQQQRVP